MVLGLRVWGLGFQGLAIGFKQSASPASKGFRV